MNIDAVENEPVRQTLLILIAHVKHKPDFTREGMLQDLSELLLGKHPASLLSMEAQRTFNLSQHECETGIATSKPT